MNCLCLLISLCELILVLLIVNLHNMICNTPKYTLVVFDMFRVFCKLI